MAQNKQQKQLWEEEKEECVNAGQSLRQSVVLHNIKSSSLSPLIVCLRTASWRWHLMRFVVFCSYMTDGGLGLYTRRLNRLPDSIAGVRDTLHRNTSSGQGDADRWVFFPYTLKWSICDVQLISGVILWFSVALYLLEWQISLSLVCLLLLIPVGSHLHYWFVMQKSNRYKRCSKCQFHKTFLLRTSLPSVGIAVFAILNAITNGEHGDLSMYWTTSTYSSLNTFIRHR